jgi:four helix bundle protein
MPDVLAPAPAATAAVPLIDAEKLDVYRVAIEFQVMASQLLPKRGHSELRDQLERASVSVVLNTAEGAGRRSGLDKARFYAMARGRATECAAVIDLVLARGLAPASTCRHARSLLIRVIQMLTKLIARVSAQVASA